jgi:hypothetical protein
MRDTPSYSDKHSLERLKENLEGLYINAVFSEITLEDMPEQVQEFMEFRRKRFTSYPQPYLRCALLKLEN